MSICQSIGGESTVFRYGKQRHTVTVSRLDWRMDTIGERVRYAREHADPKISRAELAKSVGIAYSTLSDLELGESKSTTVLHRIAARLGVRIQWLETGKGERMASTQSAETAKDPWDAIAGLRSAQTLMALALAESIPTAGRALVEALTKLPDDGPDNNYLAVLRGALRRELANQDAAALPGPKRKARGSAARKHK